MKMFRMIMNGVLKIFGVEPARMREPMQMFIEDMEMSYDNPGPGVEPSTNVVDESETQTLEPSEVNKAVHEEDKNLYHLSKDTYDSIKDTNSAASDWTEILGNGILVKKSPMENTVLHVAALYGNDNCVEWVITQNQNAPSSSSSTELLAAKNADGDTPLHVAARAGKISTLKLLLAAVLRSLPYSEKPKEALDEILAQNKLGNTFFHEALLNGHKDVMNILDSLKLEIETGFKELVERAALFYWTNGEEISVLHLAIEKGYTDIVADALNRLTTQHSALIKLIENHQELAKITTPAGESPLPQQDQERGMEYQQPEIELDSMVVSNSFYVDIEMREDMEHLPPAGNQVHQGLSELAQSNIQYNNPRNVLPGKSPLIVTILKQDEVILRIIVTKMQEWIYSRDKDGRTALHFAASIGYLNGVLYLLEKGNSCNMVRDKHGYFPLHLASAGGHVEVVKKLLEHCPNYKEIVDKYGRNIIHIAAQMGKFDVIRYILQDASYELVKMINDKDTNGNTPLHLAASHCHPKIVHFLTWDKRVDLSLVNKRNQTPLDACMQFQLGNLPLRKRLTWIALKSAGAQYAKKRSHSRYSIEVPPLPQNVPSGYYSMLGSTNMDPYKDRISTLMLVSTLIITVTFAAGFTLPGGTNSSDPEQGMALMLHHTWFTLFIFCITISMYGAIGITIILIWAQLGDITLALLALKVASPLLGLVLATLSVAFMAGVHLVISKLSWLATTILVLCLIFILMLLLLYTSLWLPSRSNKPVIRYISYYPFQFLTWWLVEEDHEIEGM